MNAPKFTAGLETRTTFAAYLVRRLVRAKYEDLATGMLEVHKGYVAAVAAVDAQEWTVQAAVADWDIADEDLDLTARSMLATLGGRPPELKKSTAYTRICPNGTPEYTEADLSEQVVKYGLFADRIEANLAADDPLRATAVGVRSQLEVWKAAVQAVADTRNARQLARDARDAAKGTWDATVVSTYGALLQRVGKVAAERFFPPAREKESTGAAPTAPVVMDPK